ncbi:hypothetical protein NC653_024213 [Populus alba x Populus x berolinensis]|uniref:Uncharacterized protein n=1 Tax=Populus alba x Populus x berolinensis TaxID=444605 RepID=A0AAD6M8B4_9ROSI|nr:hypothetical protein NC653_024213 [Populus alba x Populus x berolinensis]
MLAELQSWILASFVLSGGIFGQERNDELLRLLQDDEYPIKHPKLDHLCANHTSNNTAANRVKSL